MDDLTLAIDILTGEMLEEKKAHRALERAENLYQTNMGSEKLLPKIQSLNYAISILKSNGKDAP
jgi:hypothetical protein